MKIINNGLAQYSRCYYGKNDIYDLFANSEDSFGLIGDFFDRKARGVVLDLGCGSGKYSLLLSQKAKKYIGLDLSEKQIELAKKKVINQANIEFICSSATKIGLPDNCIDFGISCWVLGTILDKRQRRKVVTQIKRVLKKEGEFYLIENDFEGEFEKLRRGINDLRTIDYNNWLLDNGFKVYKKINTQFEFADLNQAKIVFGEIWGKGVADKIKHRFIEHKIVIFKLSTKV